MFFKKDRRTAFPVVDCADSACTEMELITQMSRIRIELQQMRKERLTQKHASEEVLSTGQEKICMGRNKRTERFNR